MSYGKDLSEMSNDEVSAYVQRIWDKHTNVSEHFVKTIYFAEIPRLATMLMAFQRHGFTMTEMSQRRRRVTSCNVEYHNLLASGVNHEDARKVLSVLEPSECVATMNREAAKQIARFFMFHLCYPDIYEALNMTDMLNFPEELGTLFGFDWKQLSYSAREFPYYENTPIRGDLAQFRKSGFSCYCMADKHIIGILPLYSFHQLIRHRTLEILMWCAPVPIYEMRNSSPVMFEFTASRSTLQEFCKTRSGPATQEPLRSFAAKLEEILKQKELD